MGDKYIKDFLNNNLIDDEESKKEFAEKLQKKIEQELVKFNKEIDKITEEKFENDLNDEANKFIETLEKTDYSKNYYKYFDDIDTFKEKCASITPDFPAKNQLLFDKAMLITRKFFDIQIGKINKNNENKMANIEKEKNNYIKQINELNNSMNQTNSKTNDAINNLSNQLNEEMAKNKKLGEKLNDLLKQNKLDKENLEKEFNSKKNDFDNKNTEFINIKKKYEDELKAKDEQILIMKMNNDKIMSLNDQKLNYFENEINKYKDKYNKVLKESKLKEEKLNKEIIILTEENKKLKIEKEKSETMKKEEANNNLNDVIKYFSEKLKTQNEENKNMLEKMFKDKENSMQNNKEIFQNMKELNEKNNELILNNNNLTNEIKSLEEQNTNLSLYKDAISNSKGLKCKNCDKIFSYEEFKEHYTNCQKGLINNTTLNNNTINFNPEKLKMKILKGRVKQDELGNPFLEYIIDVNYDTQNWRINRRFNQFSNLFKTLKNMFKGIAQMPPSASIFVNFGNNNQFSTFHENKIIQLEKFLKDISEAERFNSSQLYQNFFEIEQLFKQYTGSRNSVNLNNEINNKNFHNRNIDDKTLGNNYISKNNNNSCIYRQHNSGVNSNSSNHDKIEKGGKDISAPKGIRKMGNYINKKSNNNFNEEKITNKNEIKTFKAQIRKKNT